MLNNLKRQGFSGHVTITFDKDSRIDRMKKEEVILSDRFPKAGTPLNEW